MKKNSSLGCLIVPGLVAVLAILAFIGGSSLLARAESAFGPPSPALGPIQRIQLGLQLGWQAEALQRPVDNGAGLQEFSIPLDESTGSILRRLQAAGLIRHATLFSQYLVYTGLDTQLQAGDFELSPAMNSPQIAQALLDPTPGLVTLSILPGWRLEEIAGSLPSSGLEVSPSDFLLAAARIPAGFDFLADLPSGINLNGYFLAGNYEELERELSADELVRRLLEAGLGAQLTDEIRAGIAAQGLNLHQALTIASIVERESVLDEEMPLIASVFLNRFHNGIKLEADPTVQYAIGYDAASQSWWINPLLTGHLNTDSPYNTYLYGGLPPGPIASPSLQALQAVARPTLSDYFFFQAACDGSGVHVFSYTYEEHIRNNCP